MKNISLILGFCCFLGFQKALLAQPNMMYMEIMGDDFSPVIDSLSEIYEQVERVNAQIFNPYPEEDIFCIKAQKAGKFGLFSHKGLNLLPFEYDSIEITCNMGLLRFHKSSEMYLYEHIANKILPESYDSLVGNTLYKNGKKGILRDTISVDDFFLYRYCIIPPVYEQFLYLSYNPQILAIVKKAGKWGRINAKNELLPSPAAYQKADYDSLQHFSRGAYLGYKNTECVLINVNFDLILPGKYQQLLLTWESYLAKKNNKWGFLDTFGEAYGFEYDTIIYANANRLGRYYYAQKAGKWGLVDAQNKQILPFEYTALKPLCEPFEQSTQQPAYALSLHGKMGWFDWDSLVFILQPVLDTIHQQTFIACQNGRWGKYGYDYQLVIPFKYDSIHLLATFLPLDQNPGYLLYLGGKQGLADKQGRLLSDCLYEEIIPNIPGEALETDQTDLCFQVKLEGKWGILDKTAQQYLLPCVYDSLLLYQWNGITSTVVAYQNGKAYLYEKDSSGFKIRIENANTVQSICYRDKNTDLYNIGFWVKREQYIELFFPKCDCLKKNSYDSVLYLKNGEKEFILLGKNKKYTLLNLTDCKCLKTWYDSIHTENIGLSCANFLNPHFILVKNGQKWGILSTDFSPATEAIFETLPIQFQTFPTGTAPANIYFITTQSQKYGLINAIGEQILPYKYDYLICDICEELTFFASQNGKWARLNIEGQELLAFEYDTLFRWAGSPYLVARKQGKYGLLDEKNRLLLPFEYNQLQCLDNTQEVIGGYTFGKYHIWDKQFTRQTSYEIDSLSSAYIARKSGKYGWISPYTKEMSVPIVYDSLSGIYARKYLKARKNGKWGLITSKNAQILPFEYEQIGDFSPKMNTFAVKKQGKWGLINSEGEALTEFLDTAENYQLKADYLDGVEKLVAYFSPSDTDNQLMIWTPNRLYPNPKMGWRFEPQTRKWVRIP